MKVAAAAKPKLNLGFCDLADAVETRPRWVLDGVLPVGLTILGGPPKSVKKSTLTYAWAMAVSGQDVTGMVPPWLGKLSRESGPVLMLPMEAEAGEVKHDLRLGAGLQPKAGHVYISEDPYAWRLDSEPSVARLYEALDEYGPALVVLDPLRDFHALDEKDSGEIIRVVGPMRRWAVEHDASVVLVHHTTKPVEGRSATDPNSLRGSSALFGKVDGLIMAAPSERPGDWIDYAGTFKRGRSWSATVRLGVWDARGAAEEWIHPSVTGFMRVLAAGASAKDARAQCQLASNEKWEPVRAQLERNGLIVLKGGTYIATMAGVLWAGERP